MNSIKILAIESSCDDTGAAVIVDGGIQSNIVANQKVHKEYGGVVPELASRAHQQNIIPVVDTALKKAGVDKKELSAIAVTKGPGLLGALLVGTTFAKTMAMVLDIPIIGVHHMQAHVLAHFIDEPKPIFPFICLTVSGGHTQLVLVKAVDQMDIIGETLDDAAGEAFDKIAKILGLEYPGGPLLDQLAQQGNPLSFKFAEPKVPDLNYSFSGLKTSVLYFLRKQDESFVKDHLHDLCASVQHTIVTILMKELVKATKQFNINQVTIAGGVSANSELRKVFEQTGKEKAWQTYIPKFEYCTDNAAMIAIAGHYQYLQGNFEQQDFSPVARWKF